MKVTGAKILVTGGTGSLGGEVVRRLVTMRPQSIRVFARDEFKHFLLREELSSAKNIHYFIGDIRDRERLAEAMRGVDLVVHAAAMKHVAFCEENRNEAIKTNVIGSQNVLELARQAKVKLVIGISSDKAVSPQTHLGKTKQQMEQLFLESAGEARNPDTSLAIVRLGNVKGSRGSVIPLWKDQIGRGLDIRITDRRMKRYILESEEVTKRIVDICQSAKNGHTYVLRMPERKIIDLAEEAISTAGMTGQIRIIEMGRGYKEKLRERLLSTAEANRALQRKDYWDIPRSSGRRKARA